MQRAVDLFLPFLAQKRFQRQQQCLLLFVHLCSIDTGDLLMLLILLLLVVDGEEEDQLSVILTAAAFLLS